MATREELEKAVADAYAEERQHMTALADATQKRIKAEADLEAADKK